MEGTSLDAETLLGRRRLLALIGSATVGGFAGCNGITDQSFEASSVGLSPVAQETLLLGELGRETLTDERSAADGNASVSITTHTAVYSRAAALGGL